MQDPALPGSSPGPGPNAAATAGPRTGLSPEATPGLRPDPTPALPAALLFALVFVEGFVSLGAEIVALRRLVPHVGSAITVTAPTIGFFLLALALGYQAGGRVASNYLARVRRNFLIAAGLIAVGLAGPVADWLFAHLQPAPMAWLVLVGGVLCPVAWLLGQTVPILTNLLRQERAGARSGAALYWSTLGSFLGAVSLSLLVMQWLGVGAAVLICAGLLLALVPAIGTSGAPRRRANVAAALIGAAAVGCTLILPQQLETAYATYRIAPVTVDGFDTVRGQQLGAVGEELRPAALVGLDVGELVAHEGQVDRGLQRLAQRGRTAGRPPGRRGRPRSIRRRSGSCAARAPGSPSPPDRRPGSRARARAGRSRWWAR